MTAACLPMSPPDRWLRYVAHADVAARAAEGWRNVPVPPRPSHDAYSVIMEWTGPGAPPPAYAPPLAAAPPERPRPMIVGFCGLAGAGKSTAAKILAGEGFVCLPFAAPLKRMFAALGLAPAWRDDPRSWRETPHDLLCGRTPRQALQTLGTEWGRYCIGPDFWVRLWAAEALRHPRVVADDVRFANEAAAIRQAGGIVIRIDREGAGSASGAAHVSERIPFDPDATIVNDGDCAALAAAVAAALA